MVSSSDTGPFCSLRASTPKLWYLLFVCPPWTTGVKHILRLFPIKVLRIFEYGDLISRQYMYDYFLESLGCCWFEYLSPCCRWSVLLTQTAQQYVTVVWAADARGTLASLFIDFSLCLHFLPCLFFLKDLLAWLSPPPFSSALPIDSTLHSLNMYSTYHWLRLPFCKLRSPVALAACGCIQPQSFLLG